MFKLTSQFAGLLKLCYEQMFFGDRSFSFAQKVKKNIQCVHIFGITRVQYKGVCMRLVHLQRAVQCHLSSFWEQTNPPSHFLVPSAKTGF